MASVRQATHRRGISTADVDVVAGKVMRLGWRKSLCFPSGA